MHKRMYGLFALSAAIILASCSQLPIFWAIEQEIKLAEPAIKGNVYSVVRCGDYLYAANGNIYRKPLKSERGWEKISKPEGNAVYLASSNSFIDTHVYALSAKGETVQVYVLNGNTWQEVSGTSGKADETVIFDNGDIRDDRYAYVRVKGKVFKLKDANLVLSDNTTPVSGSSITTNGAGPKTVAAARKDSQDYFSNTRAFCKGEFVPSFSPPTHDTALYSAADDGKTIKKGTTAADLANTSVQTSETITCLVYMFDGTDPYLIAGTKKGLEKIRLDMTTGVPISASILGSNAEAAFGESEIFCVASFDNADDNAIYAGTGKASASKRNALWAYYPSRGTWNYE